MAGVRACPTAYLDGVFLPLEEARISPLDRGFLFGDGVYEVVPCYGGRPFLLERHLARLDRSLRAVGLPDPLGPAGWRHLAGELAARNGGGDLALYLQVTRGVAPRDHRFPAAPRPTVFAYANPLRPPPAEGGARAVLLEDLRWGRCDIKAISLLANVLARQAAHRRSADEAILVREGEVTEGAASNVFAVVEGVLLTPPRSPRLLPGVTRDLVLELAAEAGLPCREAPLPVGLVQRAEELWLTSSTREVVPVLALDGRPVGGGRPGPLWRRVHRLYQARKARWREGGRAGVPGTEPPGPAAAAGGAG